MQVLNGPKGFFCATGLAMSWICGRAATGTDLMASLDNASGEVLRETRSRSSLRYWTMKTYN